MNTFNIKSSEFEDNKMIPDKFTCKGENINPNLFFEGMPEETKSLVLIMDDPDAPNKTWIHWILFNIKPDNATIEENSYNGIQGKNSWGHNNYGGPCPPSGTHRYFFKAYALDSILNLNEGASKEEVETAMKKHVIDNAKLIGLYKK